MRTSALRWWALGLAIGSYLVVVGSVALVGCADESPTTGFLGDNPPFPPPPPPNGDLGPIDACVPGKRPCPDLGPMDMGPPDMGPTDMGPADMGPMDSGPMDMGPVDMGPTDMGPMDMGPPDMGPPDTGPPDMGPPDTGCDCPARQCRLTSCLDAVCSYVNAIDGFPCFGGAGACLDGDCIIDEEELCEEPITSPRVIASRPLGTDFPTASRPSVAADPDGYTLFVWTAEVDGGLEVHGRRFVFEGNALDCVDEPLVIATGMELGWDAEPTVAGLSEEGWVVTWTSPSVDGDLGGIAYRLIERDGEMDSTRRANREVLFHQHEPQVAALGDGFVIVWTDESGQSADDELAGVHARIFDQFGRGTTGEIVVPAATYGDQRQPAVAGGDDGWIVVWTDAGMGLIDTPVVRARRFDGHVAVDADDIVLSSDQGASPAIARELGGASYVLTWETRQNDPAGDIVGRRVNTVGDPLSGSSPFDVADDPDVAETAPSVVPYGDEDAIIAWHEGPDLRDGRLIGIDVSLPSEADLIDAYLHDDGVERDVSMGYVKAGAWVVWSDDGAEGELTSYRSVLAGLIPGDDGL